jgi:hypothetical protein
VENNKISKIVVPLGCLLFVVIGASFLNNTLTTRNYKSTTATVTSINGNYATIRFSTSGGGIVTTSLSLDNKYTKNSAVPILYNPINPYEVQEARDFATTWIMPIVFTFGGSALFVLAIITIVSQRQKKLV